LQVGIGIVSVVTQRDDAALFYQIEIFFRECGCNATSVKTFQLLSKFALVDVIDSTE
jgi:hypothetical protein